MDVSASVDSAELIALLDRLGASADFVCREVARDTAQRIVIEMQRRIARRTGETASGIHWELSYDERGYVVVMGRKSRKHTGVWLEFGTTHQFAKPFFFASADLEQGPHLRRLEARIQRWLDSAGR